MTWIEKQMNLDGISKEENKMYQQFNQERKLQTEGFPKALKNGMFMQRHNHLDEVVIKNIELWIAEVCIKHRIKITPVKLKDLYNNAEGKFVFGSDLFEDPAHCDIFSSLLQYESFANFITMKFDEPIKRIIVQLEVE